MQKQFERLERNARTLLVELGDFERHIAKMATSWGYDEDEALVASRITDDMGELLHSTMRDLELALVDLDMARNERGLPHP